MTFRQEVQQQLAEVFSKNTRDWTDYTDAKNMITATYPDLTNEQYDIAVTAICDWLGL